MPVETASVRKVTVSLPSSLVDFADREAARLNISRSRLIAHALAEIKAEYEERLAAEGYRFYAQEAGEFAEASASAVVEALDHDG
jgi:metal-responsive CopG/Arc/MetJ family transcriptional regulator